jgi:hypothetical protein
MLRVLARHIQPAAATTAKDRRRCHDLYGNDW